MGVADIVVFVVFGVLMTAVLLWGVFSRRPGRDDDLRLTVFDRMLLRSSWLRRMWGKVRVRRDASWPRSTPGRR